MGVSHRPVLTALAATLALTVLMPVAPPVGSGPVKVRASETTRAVDGDEVFDLPADTTHVEVHWTDNPDAVLTLAFSADGSSFLEPITVRADDDADEGPDTPATRSDPESYGPIITAAAMRAVRVTADRSLPRVTVLALNARNDVTVPVSTRTSASSPIPAIISRAGWGADETIRFDPLGDERWSHAYYPLQKLVVHHTAGANNDPNPAATVRAIYYFHAVTRDFGDIGYQYLIDEAGRVYEGRQSGDYWNGATPTADNGSGLIVEGAHAKYFNPGSMAVAVLGDFTTRPPTAAARASLERMLAWAVSTFGINPLGTSTYVNPVTGLTMTTANISGHRTYWNTACPGQYLNALLPAIRTNVAALANSWPTDIYNPPRTLTFSPGTYVGRKFNLSGTVTASRAYTLSATSSAPTGQRNTIPNQSGDWYYITAGVWAGYWIQGSAATTLGPARTPMTSESYPYARPLSLAAGTYTGRRFSSTGTVTASKTATLGASSRTWTVQRSTIPNQPGTWYSVTAGLWDGYWIPQSAATTLGDPAAPWPEPIAQYSPPATVYLAPGTYTGRRFNAYGMVSQSLTYTVSSAAQVPVATVRTIPNQPGTWYYVTSGVWDAYWLPQTTGVSLQAPPAWPPPTATYDPPATLSFAAGTYVGRKFDVYGTVIASKSYTLASASTAPTSEYRTIPTQSGSWYYITAGVWAGYWIQESAGTTLSGP